MQTRRLYATFALLILTSILSCSDSKSNTGSSKSITEDIDRPDGWGVESHSKDADPNYDLVLGSDVKQIDIVISDSAWQVMMTDMEQNYGTFGSSSMGGPAKSGLTKTSTTNAAPQEATDACLGLNIGESCTVSIGPNTISGTCNNDLDGAYACIPDNGGTPPGVPPDVSEPVEFSSEDPVFVPCDVEFEGLKWTKVGIRFKGNSSLSGSWGSGSFKMPFKLDFDEFEDEFPEINDQRFYGFKKLSFGNNIFDDSQIREKVASDIFREAGVPTAIKSFYRVYIDVGDGEGSKYFGLYTGSEMPWKPFLNAQFGNDEGNLYKPDGGQSKFESSNLINETSFPKKTNEDAADWSDINNLITALNDSTRSTNPATWRAELETHLNTDNFLRWLAVNTVIQNWDTYGISTHNFYFYADPNDANRFTWIPWDNNEALQNSHGRAPLSLDLSEVGADWPMIRNLMDDSVYNARYWELIQEFNESDVFSEASLSSRFQMAHDLIEPYVTGTDGEQNGYTLIQGSGFETSVSDLNRFIQERKQAVIAELSLR